MKTLVLHKVAVLAAAVALGGAGLANDALAKSGGSGHGDGGGVHHFVGSLRDHGFHGRRMGGDFSRNYGNRGFECWKSQAVPTNAAWRLRQGQRGTCF